MISSHLTYFQSVVTVMSVFISESMSYCLRTIPLLRPVTVSRAAVCRGASLHTSQGLCLRKAPANFSFLGTLWTYFPWPSYLLKAWIRRRYTPEKFGPSEEYHRSMFHRLSVVYAVTAWSALGRDIDKGGAMYWINALKTPDEMQDMGSMKIVKFQGLKYNGVEDVTVKMKELGQEKARRAQLAPDFYLRRRYDIPQETDGGPSIAEVREKIEAEGKDYMLELDYANQLNRAKTRYNPDGTVGEFI